MEIKKKILSYSVIICMIVALIPALPMEANAAEGDADKLVEHALSHEGNIYNDFYDRGPYNTEWCAQFVEHCSARAGLSSIIPTEKCAVVDNLAADVVNNKGGRITYVNSAFYKSGRTKYNASRRCFNSSYSPKKGDLILFYNENDVWKASHIGIVTKNTSSALRNVPTIEGNTAGDYWWTSKVAQRTRTSEAKFRIVAYVTPRYLSEGDEEESDIDGIVATRETIVDEKVARSNAFQGEGEVGIIGIERSHTSMMLADLMKKTLGVGRFDTVILASGIEYPDGLGSSTLSNMMNAPVLIVTPNTEAMIAEYLGENFNRGGQIIIAGGTGAVSARMENRVSDLGQIIRLGGADRYETNTATIKHAMYEGAPNDDLIVVSGENFADALSASATGKMIMIVGQSLTDSQKELMHSDYFSGITILGGTGAVSQEVEEEIRTESGRLITRLGGSDRIQTSDMAADRYFPGSDCSVYTKADGFADGLSGGLLANTIGAPVRLTYGTRNIKSSSVEKMRVVVGGVK